ncbi:heparan-alpha-glucosaminide N-acetyltransferase [Palleronia sp.]|uniref:heparan-alpha-glucosaminide N-acetyltransferase n=1 Tax=Palleronia sp. TaxID=1940284 RepID=UPI0035C7CB38
MSPAPVSAAPPQRVAWIDRARGVALLAMIVYHFSFDLALFGVVRWDVGGAPHWRGFAILIAASFIALSGLSLALSARGGIRWRAFLRRLALLVAAAAAVTVGTWFAMGTPVTFGILHAIALFSVLALPFLRTPPWVPAVVAVVVFLVPFAVQSEALSALWLYPLGLDPTPIPSFDYEPLFPWFAAMLAGIAAAPYLPTPRSPVAPDLLARMGRHSLAIYLLHQPILFGLLLGARQLALL